MVTSVGKLHAYLVLFRHRSSGLHHPLAHCQLNSSL